MNRPRLSSIDQARAISEAQREFKSADWLIRNQLGGVLIQGETILVEPKPKVEEKMAEFEEFEDFGGIELDELDGIFKEAGKVEPGTYSCVVTGAELRPPKEDKIHGTIAITYVIDEEDSEFNNWAIWDNKVFPTKEFKQTNPAEWRQFMKFVGIRFASLGFNAEYIKEHKLTLSDCLDKMLGKPVIVTVKHNPNKDNPDDPFVNVSKVVLDEGGDSPDWMPN